MSSDRYLKLRNGRSNYYYQRAVPRDLQRKFGKVISECLHTADKKEARKLRDVKSVHWSAEFDRARARKEQRGPVSKSHAILDQLRGTLTAVLKDNEWPDPEAAEASPWEDLANSVSDRGDAVPLELQQQVFRLAKAISAYHNDPAAFDREAASELVVNAEPKKTMAELRDQYLKDKESQGIRQKSLDSQKSRLSVLEENDWNVEQVRQILKQNERTDTTIANWMMTYTTFSNWLQDKHGVELSVPKFRSTKFSSTRDVFTPDELKAIFRYPMDETMRWICLVSLHQGFRASETLQLAHADIRKHHGYWVFDIHDRGDKTVKTASTARKVPLHPWLIENGFLKYWKDNKGWATGWHSYDGTASQGFSKAVNRVIRSALGLETSDTDTGKKVFHSFRHTFRDYSREAGLQEYTIDLIGGWSTKKYGEGAGYGVGHSMKLMSEVLGKVDFQLAQS